MSEFALPEYDMSGFETSKFDIAELPLVGRGRAADVLDVGDGRVLRRYRTPHPGLVEREALAMQFLRTHGAPVPQVFGAGGDDLVMERLEGRSMLDELKARPWRAAAIGRQLAQLHHQIHRIPAGDVALPRFGDGDSILHLDLHPDNVMLTDHGPMIIDWSNVAVGAPLADAMNTWMLMCTSSVDDVPAWLRPLLRRIRGSLTNGFIADTPLDDEARNWLVKVCDRRLNDPNTLDEERTRVRAFDAAHGPATPE